jgi:hypothetical protein
MSETVFEEDENIIYGRPDFEANMRGEKFGVTRAKKHPPYIYSISANSALIHKIAYVEMHWWQASSIKSSGDCLRRLHKPRLIARTVCGMNKFMTADRSRTCTIPRPDAVRCGKCHGFDAPFGKEGWATKAGVKKSEAYVKLGCVAEESL